MKFPSNLFKFLSVLFLAMSVMSNAWAQLVSGPMLGDVTETHAKIWIKAKEAAEVKWIVSTDEDLSTASIISNQKVDEKTHFTGVLNVAKLNPGTKYFYNLVVNNQPVFQKPFPFFVTSASTGHLRVAFSSCLGRSPSDSDPAWKDMAQKSFDLLLLLGDQHYADTVDPQILFDHYMMYRANEDFKFISRHKPVYTVWDDHDYGANDSDRTLVGKEGSLAVFTEVWPNPAFGEKNNPGVYYSFLRGDVEFFMLDTRYYRSPDDDLEDGQKTMLGSKQLAWFKKELKKSKARIKIIATSVEINGAKKSDSWFSYLRERKSIMDFIANHKIEGVIFISGDSHYTASFQMKEGFLEFTSGPLGSKPSKLHKNSYLLEGFDQGHYYSILDIDTASIAPQVSWEVYGALPNGKTHQSKCVFDWPTILGKKKAQCKTAD
jgi:alkaline phosphatase D